MDDVSHTFYSPQQKSKNTMRDNGCGYPVALHDLEVDSSP
jgi:hypothetical protein